MSIEAFTSRRVTESLRAIASYLDEGAKIARGVPSGQVLALNPVDVPTTPAPRLTDLVWADTGTRTILVGPGPVQSELRAHGEHLQGAVLRLLSTKGGATFQSAPFARQGAPDSDEFSAIVDLSDPKNGSYRALVVTPDGDTFFSARKLKIKPLPDEPEQPGTEIQLGELDPNEGTPGGDTFDATLTLLRGTAQDVDDVYLTDLDGHRLDWTQLGRQNAAARRALLVRTQGLEAVTVTISIPDSAEEGAYCLVATSPNSESQDRLLFHVVEALPDPESRLRNYEPVPTVQPKEKPNSPPDPPPAPESKSKSK